MKNLSLTLTALFLCALFSVAAVAQPAAKKVAPSATFQKIWVDYDVKEEGRNGMRIHTAFKVYGMKEVPSYLQIKFQQRDGAALMDKNNSFDSTDGEVAVFGTLKPGFEPTVYENFDVFMPYEELDLSSGKYALKMDVDVIYENGDLVQHLTFYNFDFTQPGKTVTPVKNNSSPSAAFKRLWVDYGVTEGGKLGMRVHVNCTVYGMKNVPSYLAVYFKKRDGTKLLTNNVKYRSTEGQVAVFRELDVGYDPGEYADLTVFMPYSEFSLNPGKYALGMEVNLIYKEGGLIQALTDYDFDYTKP